MDIRNLIILGGGIAFLYYYTKKQTPSVTMTPVIIPGEKNARQDLERQYQQEVSQVNSKVKPSRSRGKNQVSFRGSL